MIEVVLDNGNIARFRLESVAFMENRFKGDVWLGSRVHFASGAHIDCEESMDQIEEAAATK